MREQVGNRWCGEEAIKMHECRRELVQQKDKISYSFIEKEINVRTKK